MPDPTSETDILIVGGGPVGLFLANECARRGLQFRIVETNATQSQHSKALAIFPRTLEIFDMAGIVDPFLQEANQVTSVAVLTHGQTLARMPFRPQETPYQFVAMVPQNVTEGLLAEQLARRAGSVEYETTFVSATEERGSLTALLNRKGESIRLKASFIVGCDGAHSAVRHMLKLPFEGGEYENSYILADVETNNALPANQLQLCPSETGPVAIFPMSATRRRVIATVDKIEGEPPSLSLVRKILTERGPRDIVARSLQSVQFSNVRRVDRRGRRPRWVASPRQAPAAFGILAVDENSDCELCHCCSDDRRIPCGRKNIAARGGVRGPEGR